jgi:excisionase family DNA binding protein
MTTDVKLALRPNDAARALGVGRDKLFALLADGSIRSFREGNTRLIPVKAIEDYMARRLQEDA